MTKIRARSAIGILGAVATAVVVGGGSLAGTLATPALAASTPPPIHHVFVVNLENQSYATTFGSGSKAPYLANTLPSQGALLTQYYGIGHNSLDNYIAEISGQAPTPDNQADCQTFIDVTPATAAADGQITGNGCVYPASVTTIADQLAAAGMTWKGYMEDMGNTPSREATTCGHPTLGSADNTEKATAADQYASRHDPFVYFHSIIDSPSCNADVVPLSRFANDLSSTATTANLSFITPNLCDDGHDAPCANGQPGGLTSVNSFLQSIVPRITSSPAYQADGMLVITFDEAEGDSSACCGEQSGPNVTSPGGNGPGGGRVGAVVLSPYVAPGTVSNTPYNHYSLLSSLEDVFGLTHLGYAGVSALASFGSDVYTNAPPPAQRIPVARIAGTNRVDTAVQISQASFKKSGSAKAVVLARDDQFADALAGGPLAAQMGGPLLLTAPSALDPEAETEIKRVLPSGSTVYLLGGTSALAGSMDTQLQSDGYKTSRLAGSDRFGTAVLIAQAMGSPTTVFEATGLNYPDALAGVPAAIANKGAILLTSGSSQAAATAKYISGLSRPTRYALGGQAAAADPSATAFAGADRYQTATLVAGHFFASPTTVGAASALAFPDALGAGPFLGAQGAPLILVPPTGQLPQSVADYLTANQASLTSGTVFGGTSAVSEPVRQWVAGLG
jgi:phosphatidylinositol-3-phosphatase